MDATSGLTKKEEYELLKNGRYELLKRRVYVAWVGACECWLAR